MSEHYDGPDLKPEVQVDDKKPEEALVVPQEGILEGDTANASALARDILASVVDEVIRQSKIAPADNVYTSSLDKTPARGNVSCRPIVKETLDNVLQLEHLIEWDDSDSNGSFASFPDNDQNTNLQNNIIHHSKSNDIKEKLQDVNADSKTGMLCFSSLESLGSLKELPSGGKVILDVLSRGALETSQAKDATQCSETKSLKIPDNQNIKSEEKQDNSFSETLNTILSSSVAVLGSIEQTNDLTKENKPDITLSNKEEFIKTNRHNDKTKLISKESRKSYEQTVESNCFKTPDKGDIMEKSASDLRDITSKEAEENTDSLNIKESDDSGEIKGDITDTESSVTTSEEGEFAKTENTERTEDIADNVEDNSHDEVTPTTSDAKDETVENEQESTCDTQAERTVHSATLYASDNAMEVRSPAPLSAKCPIERPAGGAEAKAAGSSASPRLPSVGARRTSSPPTPPPLVAELARRSPSAEQLRVALAKEISNRAPRAAAAGPGPEYDLFWSTVGLLRRYEDPMRPTSSQARTARADVESNAADEGDGDGDDEDEGEEDEEVAAAIDAINALFPAAELEDDDDDEEDDDDVDEVPPKRVLLQRDDDEEENAVHPTPSFRRVVSVHSHSVLTPISKPHVPYLPTPTPFTAQPAKMKEKKSFKKRLQKFFSHPFGNKKNKAKTGNLSVP